MSNFGFRDRLRHAFPEDENIMRSSSFDNLFDRAFGHFPRPFSNERYGEPEEFYRGGERPGEQQGRSSFSNRGGGFPPRGAPSGGFPPSRGGGYYGSRGGDPTSMPPSGGRYGRNGAGPYSGGFEDGRDHRYDDGRDREYPPGPPNPNPHQGQGQDYADYGGPPEPQEPRYSQQMPRQEKTVKIEVEHPGSPHDQPPKKYFTNEREHPSHQGRGQKPNFEANSGRFQDPPMGNVSPDIPIPMPPPEARVKQPSAEPQGANGGKNGTIGKSAKLNIKKELDPPSPNPIPMPPPEGPTEPCVITLGGAGRQTKEAPRKAVPENFQKPGAASSLDQNSRKAPAPNANPKVPSPMQSNLPPLQSPGAEGPSGQPAAASRKMSRQASIGEVGDKIITMLDEIERRVEKLRDTAALLEDEKRQLLDMLNTVDRNKDMLSPSGEKEDIEAITSRLLSRAGAVDVSVRTPRNPRQEEALSIVNRKVDDLLHLMRENIDHAHDTCTKYVNASSPDQPDGAIDQRFQSILIECTADDQKRVRKRLNQILKMIENPQTEE